MRFTAQQLTEDSIRAHREIAALRPQESLIAEQEDDVKRDIVTFVEIIVSNGDFPVNAKDA